MKKKALIISFIASLLLITFKSGFAAEIKHVYKSQTELTQGVTFYEYEIFFSDRHWSKVYVAEADLNYPHLSLNLVPSKNGSSYLSTVTELAKSVDSTVAINSDFFAWGSQSGRGSPVGALYFDKKMYSSPASDSGMYTIMQDENRNVFADIVEYSLVLTAPNGEQMQIAGKNKLSDLSKVMMYDKYYDEYSLGSTETQYEVVIKNNIVSEIRFSSEPIKLVDNMYVLAGLSDHDTFLLDNLKIGDKVKIEESSNFNFEDLNFAAGAGAKLVENGKTLSSFSHTVSGVHPRTAFGISKNKKTVYFVVIDGRSSSTSGMSMAELASFMHYIGSYNAVNLDGGGSSTFVTKNLKSGAQELINTPSGGSQRKVSAALSVVSSIKKPSTLYHLKLTSNGDNVFVNSHINLFVEGFDKYYFPVNIDTARLSYSVSGVDGYFSKNKFIPTTTGTATITAHMPGGANASIKIKVLDTPYSIELNKSNIKLNIKDKAELEALVRDENGYGAYVPLSDMKINFSDNIAHIENDMLVADKNGSALMSIAYGDAISYASLQIGSSASPITLPKNKTALDSKNKTDDKTESNVQTRFAVFGAIRESDTLFNNLVMQKSLKAINKSANRAFFLSTKATKNIAPNMTIPTKTCYPFSSFTEGNNKYIILDTEDNFMSSKEWIWLLDELENTNSKNLFLFMQTDVDFVNPKETKLLKDILTDVAQRGVNVYVFSTSNETKVVPENGVRYIKTPGFSDDIKTFGFTTLQKKLLYILVDIKTNGSVTYRFVPIY